MIIKYNTMYTKTQNVKNLKTDAEVIYKVVEKQHNSYMEGMSHGK